MNINLEDWLLKEQGAYATGTDSGAPPQGSMTTDPALAPSGPEGEPAMANMPPSDMATPPRDPEDEENYADDPEYPDMPEEKEHKNFEEWKKEFYKLSIKNDVQEMKEAIYEMTDKDLDPYQDKFVHDNLQILFLREQSNINKACNEIRKLIKEDLDRNNPSTSLSEHIVAVVKTEPYLASVFIKLEGLYGMKPDPHRKYLASLMGAIQVGSGGNNEDLLYNEKNFPPIRISTRINSRFGDIFVGDWNLRADDPERYLKLPELQRLEDGSPEEKEALRHRIIVESISETYKNRSFLCNVVGKDGTVYMIGIDFANSLKVGFTDGKLLVRTKKNSGNEAMIDSEGNIISLVDIKINFVRPTGEVDDNGDPVLREYDFIERRGGQLFVTAQLKTIKEASASFPGIAIREVPWNGNPSDIHELQKCVPSMTEIMLRQC